MGIVIFPKNSLSKVFRLLLDPRVSGDKKLVFIAVTLLYWVLPDLMPFLPFDDILVTLIASLIFSRAAQRDLTKKNYRSHRSREESKDIIEIEGFTVDEK